jgi:hypothetical protein
VTPVIDYSDELLYTMANISALAGPNWYFGLAFADATNLTNTMQAAAAAERILGNNLLALQMSNEPDLYGIDSRRRPNPYSIQDYIREFDGALKLVEAEPGITNRQIFLAPSICCNVDGNWDVNAVVPPMLENFKDDLKVISVQHYPDSEHLPEHFLVEMGRINL